MKPTVLLIDDHQLVVEGLKKLLEEECDLVGTASDGQAAINLAKQLSPDIVLMDISMPGLNGLETAWKLRTEAPNTRIVFLTMQSSKLYIEEAFRSGASGYVLKSCAASELVQAIRDVMAGKRFIASCFAGQRTPNQVAHLTKSNASGNLTRRQQQVLQLVGEGRSIKDIASVLHISPKTVEFHKANLMRDLAVRTSGELIRFAIESGLVGAPAPKRESLVEAEA